MFVSENEEEKQIQSEKISQSASSTAAIV